MRVTASMLVATVALGLSACGHPPGLPDCAVRFTIPPPPGTQFTVRQIPALSQDGSRVVFTAVGADRITRAWIQVLDGSAATSVPGSEGAALPFWAPDARQLGFFADGRLKRVTLVTGEVQVLGETPSPRGGSWSTKDVIIVSAVSGPASGRAIFGIPAAGGAARQLTNRGNDSVEQDSWPAFLPDGEHFVYASAGDAHSATFIGSIRSVEKLPVYDGASSTTFTSDAFWFAGGELLLRSPFNHRLLRREAGPAAVAQAVARGPFDLASFTASADGSVVVYGRAGSTIVWLTADGKELLAAPDPGAYSFPSLSPAGDEVLVAIGVPWLGKSSGVYYVYGLNTHQWRRVAEGSGGAGTPLWSADGSEVIFTAGDQNGWRIVAVRADGSGGARTLFGVESGTYAVAVSRNGLMALVERASARRSVRLRVVSLSGDGSLETRTIWQRTMPLNQDTPPLAFSPDGRRLSFLSDESGVGEIYVSDLTPSAEPVRVSLDGGSVPVWSGDGRHLFFTDRSGLAVVTTDGPPATWAGRHRQLFAEAFLKTRFLRADPFDVARDGTRFLMIKRPDPSVPAPLVGLRACEGRRTPVALP